MFARQGFLKANRAIAFKNFQTAESAKRFCYIFQTDSRHVQIEIVRIVTSIFLVCYFKGSLKLRTFQLFNKRNVRTSD